MQIFVPGPSGFVARPFVRPLDLAEDGGIIAPDGVPGSPPARAARLVPFSIGPGKRSAALLTRWRGLRVNGSPPLPMAILRRGDEIRLAGVSLFFTDEEPLRVVAFEPASGPDAAAAECARCHGTIRPGDPIVRCPVCSLTFMAQPDKRPNCWTFGPCLCGRDPAVEFVWRPPEVSTRGGWASRPWRKAPAGTPESGGIAS